MSKHTPGPWKTNGDPYVSTYDGRRTIAFTDARADMDENKANARLIAASPELVEAATIAYRALVRLTENDPHNDALYEHARETLKSALIKAVGGKE